MPKPKINVNSTYEVINNSKNTSIGATKAKLLEENFDDSLEAPVSLQLPSLSWPEPFTPDRLQTSFCCSTGNKSKGCSSLADNSAETYLKGNTSGGTYVKDTHLNNSGGTYVKDSSIANLADVQLSPMELKFTNSNITLSPCFDSPHLHHALARISEESSLELTPIKKKKTPTTPIRKLKSSPKVNLTYEVKVTPVKKTVSPVKRLSKGYSMKPLHLKQFVQKPLGPSGINAIAIEVTNTHNPDMFYNSVCNPYVLSQTNGVDPFIALTMYYDPQWVDEQIVRFKNWLNTLLVPPKDLHCTNVKVDVAKMWQECRNKDVQKAPTKEQVSNKYNTNHLLQSLRHLAAKLYRSPEIIVVLSKTHGLVENNKFVIRADRDLHQDIRLQKEILQLFFCYNPLWLRIGLEQVYGVHIHLRSNSDVLGLSKFLMMNFFNNQYLLKKYKHKSSPKYAPEMKKDALKKFLSLVYFLDQAKQQKLIPYDPCLFCKNAQIKESKEILLRFSSELFHASGDVTKPLRILNYILQYKQTYIHEFEYGVDNLGSDLKDGVRLTRVMEIILLERNLTDLLRVPAISRLQKVYNVKLAFDALKRAGYVIESQIEPKDIVEGHREKTLSFLWQIIYKFQSPRYTKAVISVQMWWRSPVIQEKRKRLRDLRFQKHNAAIVIQKWYRRHKLRLKLEEIIPFVRLILEEIKLSKAAVKIQANYRMYRCRRDYLRVYHSILIIQRQFKRWYTFSHLRKKRVAAAVVIQNIWRTYTARKRFLLLKQSVAVISTHYIATKQMRECHNAFTTLRTACINVQRRFRATLLMKTVRNHYLRVQLAVCTIQTRWRATLSMRQEKQRYQQLQNAVITVQRRFRAQQVMKSHNDAYITLKQNVLMIQRRFRAKIERREYITLKQNVIFVQRRFRANLLARKHRGEFIQLKNAVSVIERRYYARKLMLQCRNEFIQIVKSAIVIQTRFRAFLNGKSCRNNYLQLKNAVKVIEVRYEALMLMRMQQRDYKRKLQAAILIQRRFRAQRQMLFDRSNFLCLREAVVRIQTQFRANLQRNTDRNHYLSLRNSSLVIQRKWRATMTAKEQENKFKSILQSIKRIQAWYRGVIAMRTTRNHYKKLQKSVLFIQRQFRANKMAKQAREEFIQLKKAVSIIETRYYARKQMINNRNEFIKTIKSTIIIQTRFRALLQGRICRRNYLQLKNAVKVIETRYEALISMRTQQTDYKRKQQAAILIQRKFRAQLSMKKHRNNFFTLRKATMCIQTKFRAHLQRNIERNNYLRLRNSSLVIQRKWRATQNMQLQRARYRITLQDIKTIQRWYRAVILMRTIRNAYQKLRETTILIQTRFRANINMKQERNNYLTLKRHVIIIQQRFRANQLMKTQRKDFITLKTSTIAIQRRFRANLLMKQARSAFLTQKQAVVKIQQFTKGYLEMKKEQRAKIQKLRSILLLQIYVRGFIARKKFEEMNKPEVKEQRRLERLQKSSAIKIQAAWRGYKVRSQQSVEMVKMRMSLEAVNRDAKPEDTIRNRTHKSLKVFMNEKSSMLQVLGVLKELLTSTRLSPRSCVYLSKKMLCEYLYEMILSTCRSRIDMEAGSVATGILVNVAKYEKTNAYAWIPTRLPKVLNLMVACCDKEYDFFPKLATLLWVFGHNAQQKKEICDLPAFGQQMAKMLTLCERQQKMVSKSYKSKNVSVFAAYKTLALPMIKPDWGLEYAHAPYSFTNSLHAIRSLCELFNV